MDNILVDCFFLTHGVQTKKVLGFGCIIFTARSELRKAVVPCQNKIILKIFTLFRCFILTRNHV